MLGTLTLNKLIAFFHLFVIVITVRIIINNQEENYVEYNAIWNIYLMKILYVVKEKMFNSKLLIKICKHNGKSNKIFLRQNEKNI